MAVKRLILVFLKFPEPGKVKTRLARALGDAEAAKVYRRLVAAVFRTLEGLEGAAVRVLFDPPAREAEVVTWLSGLLEHPEPAWLDFVPQAEGDLGERLGESFKDAFREGFDAVAAVGTDCVDLSPATFARTWEMLRAERDAADVVLGPSADGGYYLVAMKRLHRSLFEGIPWSSHETLEASLRAAAAAGLRVGLLEELRDVDDVEDWEAVAGRIAD